MGVRDRGRPSVPVRPRSMMPAATMASQQVGHYAARVPAHATPTGFVPRDGGRRPRPLAGLLGDPRGLRPRPKTRPRLPDGSPANRRLDRGPRVRPLTVAVARERASVGTRHHVPDGRCRRRGRARIPRPSSIPGSWSRHGSRVRCSRPRSRLPRRVGRRSPHRPGQRSLAARRSRRQSDPGVPEGRFAAAPPT